MATVRCWALHGDVRRAIDYILNEDKTSDGELVQSTNYAVEQAGLNWRAKETFFTGGEQEKNDIVGFHFQQSFEAGSTTPDEAREISKQWIESITGGNYDYVLAVHTDKAHIHTHIIVNPRNNVTNDKMQIFYKKDLPLFKELSDKICIEYGKSVLQHPQGKGKSYYEWLLQNQGDSLKDFVSKTVDTLIPLVKDYDDFKNYLEKLGYTIEDGLERIDEVQELNHFEIKANVGLINPNLSTEDDYFIRLPKTNDYIKVHKKSGQWIDNDTTFKLKIEKNVGVIKYDESGEVKTNIKAEHLLNYFDDATNLNKGRQGLRIKVPNSNKFIRCDRIDKNDNDEGYSLDDILKRIDNNGRYVSEPLILKVLQEEFDVKEEKNHFYKLANIKTKWETSRYYQMSKKERYVAYKTAELQRRLDSLHQSRKSFDDYFIVDELKANRQELYNELTEVSKKLYDFENQYEQIQIERLADQLEVSDIQLNNFIEDGIIPLRKLRLKIKDEITHISERIEKAEKEYSRMNNLVR